MNKGTQRKSKTWPDGYVRDVRGKLPIGRIRLLKADELPQCEATNRYSAAVVRKVRKHPQEMGCIREDELLAGDLDCQDFKRLPREDEAVVLRWISAARQGERQ